MSEIPPTKPWYTFVESEYLSLITILPSDNFGFIILMKLSLLKDSSEVEGYVVRMPKAYPVYDLNYSNNKITRVSIKLPL